MNQTRYLWLFPAAWLDILDIPFKWCSSQTGPESTLHWDINLLGSQNSLLQQHNWICPQEYRHCLCGAGTLYIHLDGMSHKGRPAVIKVLLGYFQNSIAFWRFLQSPVCNFKAVNLNIPLLFSFVNDIFRYTCIWLPFCLKFSLKSSYAQVQEIAGWSQIDWVNKNLISWLAASGCFI